MSLHSSRCEVVPANILTPSHCCSSSNMKSTDYLLSPPPLKKLKMVKPRRSGRIFGALEDCRNEIDDEDIENAPRSVTFRSQLPSKVMLPDEDAMDCVETHNGTTRSILRLTMRRKSPQSILPRIGADFLSSSSTRVDDTKKNEPELTDMLEVVLRFQQPHQQRQQQFPKQGHAQN